MRLPTVIPLLALSLVACGGGGSGGSGPAATAPGQVAAVTVNAGDQVLHLGWSAPAANGGAAITGYTIDISPAVPAASITVSGTRALVTALTNGVTYQMTVAAMNSAGTGAASAAVAGQPRAANSAGYAQLLINGNPPPGSGSGVYDPALLRADNDDLWLAYSAVDFYLSGMDVVQDVGTRVARSTDNGVSFDWVATVSTAAGASVTDTDPMLSACGLAFCTGRWVYETPTLVEDPSDPDPDKRFKLFAHKYFLYPQPGASKTLYHLGAIVKWTASSPDAAWSAESVVLRWPLTPPQFLGGESLVALDPALANCLLVAEPGAAVVDQALWMVFACPYIDAVSSEVLQKIVLLQSPDHGVTFNYAGTLLSPADAPAGVKYFSAPSLIARQDQAPVLLATAVNNSGAYSGSRVFAFASGNSVFASMAQARSILSVPLQAPSHIGGASSYARDTGNLGIIQSDAIPDLMALQNTQFRILATASMVEQ